MRPENAARVLAVIGTILLILAAMVRLLAVYFITLDARFLPGGLAPFDRQPVMGLYHFVNDDKDVTFMKGVTVPSQNGTKGLWVGDSYYLNLETDEVQAGSPPTIQAGPGFFETKSDGELVVHDENLRVGLAAFDMVTFAISQYGNDLAFVVKGEQGKWNLYYVRGAHLPTMGGNYPRLIDTEDAFADITWDIHGDMLTYVAPRDRVNQVFLFQSLAGKLNQITYDDSQKSSPVISPDDKYLAFLSEHHVDRPNTNFQRTSTPLTLPPQFTERTAGGVFAQTG